MSQEALAAEAEITREYLSAIERSEYSVSVDVIERLAKALKIEPNQLLDKSLKVGKPH